MGPLADEGDPVSSLPEDTMHTGVTSNQLQLTQAAKNQLDAPTSTMTVAPASSGSRGATRTKAFAAQMHAKIGEV